MGETFKKNIPNGQKNRKIYACNIFCLDSNKFTKKCVSVVHYRKKFKTSNNPHNRERIFMSKPCKN